MKPTIKDIATASGVSKGTVSRVINGHQAVAPVTRERVLDIMERLGYQPDPAARQLSWRTGRTLGLSPAPGDPLLSPYHVLFRRALERQTGQLGLTLREIDEHDHLAAPERLPSAVMIMHVRDEDVRLPVLRARNVPTVLIGHQPGWPWVAPDDVGGAALAARHLTDLGHRDLMFVGAGDSQVARDRFRGFTETVTAAGAALAVRASDFSTLGGYRAVRAAWASGERPTAVFAVSDEVAVGAIVALRDLGLRVPEDVSVVGFDGLPDIPSAGSLWTGRLTTVAQDIAGVANCALELVLEALAGLPPRGEFVPVRFVVGETTGHPAGHVPAGGIT
jgi:LacI family transcriptional regulator